jgi:ABC-type branched-subunit amino acid transport system ATPase component/sugar phosphate permease
MARLAAVPATKRADDDHDDGPVTDGDPRDLVAAVLRGEAERQAEQTSREQASVPTDAALPGIGGTSMSLGKVLRIGGLPIIGVLCGLIFVDALDGAAFGVLGPDIQQSLHLSDLALGVVGAIGGLVVVVAALPLGTLADRRRRTTIVGICTLIWAAFAALLGMVQTVWQLLGVRVVAGIAKANDGPVHQALLSDAYPVEGRNRVLGLHRAAAPLGMLLGPLGAGALASVAGAQGWRWVFVVISVPAGLLGLAALRLREPRRGRHEMLSVLGEEVDVAEGHAVSLEAGFARLRKVQTFRYVLCALGVLGLAFVSAPIYINLFLKHRYGLSAAGRGVVGTLSSVGSLLGAVIGGTAGDRVFRRSPERAVQLTGALTGAFGVLFAIALFMPNVVLYTLFSGLATGSAFCGFVPMSGIIASVTPYRLRSTGFATVGLYMALFGGLGGALLVGQLGSAYGDRTALVVVALPAALLGGALIAYGSRHVRGDIALAAADLREERDELERVAAGGEVPMLQVRNLDVSYGPVQVLFDVSVDVWPGEVLALLGTNGAGKSTLLRAVCGLSVPDRGTVRLQGQTMTFSEPSIRVRAGIVMVPGGKAIFPTVSVRDNLRAAALSSPTPAAAWRTGIDRVTELFPILAERMDQTAGTMSGGEQQMLGLAMALMLEPKLLVIDELSLGLAPVVVQALLAVVERLKAEGMTMVIVEQSVNVALAIADRAVFMEKGQVRFEGPAADLLDRDDLVRAVFLGAEGG